jgi:predicted nucleic acid-binding Zn ribbon protein
MTWRPLHRPDDGRDDVRPVAESLGKLAQRLGLGDPSTLQAVFGDWESVVGPALADHCRPERLRDGELVVLVDDPAWATEVRFLGEDIRVRCNAKAGQEAVRTVVVRVDTRGLRRGPRGAS